MDYVVGGVAALITGNVTPNRPRTVKRALTPVKHQQSPNITPKSELVEDRSIFMSPTLQKKKAIMKKSPKRIFDNPDLDLTENENAPPSPKVAKVKKHLTDHLDSESVPAVSKKNKSKSKQPEEQEREKIEVQKESPKKTKKVKVKQNKDTQLDKTETVDRDVLDMSNSETRKKTKKKSEVIEPKSDNNKKSKRKKNKKSKTNSKDNKIDEKTKHVHINPNAVTTEDTDSEHESDNELEPDNDGSEEFSKPEKTQSSDEEEEPPKKKKTVLAKPANNASPSEELKRTIFVGNVTFSKKCKKEIKKVFSKHGTIETVRIRSVAVKDPKTTQRLAAIKNELHPDRSTVNVYVKFKELGAAEQALSENNTLFGTNHLRVTRCDSNGIPDQTRALFVGNMPFSIEDETLREKFSKCGEINSVRIIRDRKTNVGKGFGYVNFASRDGVELALLLTEEDLTIKNRIMRVKRCLHNPIPHKSKNKTNTQPNSQPNQGAARRLMLKRRNEVPKDEPPQKRNKIVQPQKEKKQRKEFVGMTAERKKKKKFNKGQKKKQALREILSKK